MNASVNAGSRKDDRVLWRDRELDFQVNNETYFLSLAEDERQWLVHVETPNGPLSIPVYVDEETSDDEAKIVVEDKQRRKIVN